MAVIVLQNGVPVDKQNRKTWVYAIRVLKENIIKIGVTCRLRPRMLDIRAERGSDIVLIGIMPGSRADEQRFHKALKNSQFLREYYNDTQEVQDFVNKHLIPHDRHGFQIKPFKPYQYRGLQPYLLTPEKTARYIQRILAAPDSDRPKIIEIMFRRFPGRFSDRYPECYSLVKHSLGLDYNTYNKRNPDLSPLLAIIKDRLGVDVEVVAS